MREWENDVTVATTFGLQYHWTSHALRSDQFKKHQLFSFKSISLATLPAVVLLRKLQFLLHSIITISGGNHWLPYQKETWLASYTLLSRHSKTAFQGNPHRKTSANADVGSMSHVLFSCRSNSTNNAMYLFVCQFVPNFPKSVSKTSTEARLAPDSCTVAYKQLYMSTLRVWSCSAWSKPFLLSYSTPATPIREYFFSYFMT